MKKLISVTISLIIVGIVAYVAYKAVMVRGPREAFTSYIEAVKERDFDTIYWLNHRTQKQVNLILRRSNEGDKDELLREVHEGHKRNFKSMSPTDDPTLLWAEKFFFIPEMEYRILQIKRVKERGSPSSAYRSKDLAKILIEFEYTNPETAPIYKGKKIKDGRFHIDMILSKDVVKGLKTRPYKEGWLFQLLKIEGESIVFWDSG